jgi:hypothetical protein
MTGERNRRREAGYYIRVMIRKQLSNPRPTNVHISKLNTMQTVGHGMAAWEGAGNP